MKKKITLCKLCGKAICRFPCDNANSRRNLLKKKITPQVVTKCCGVHLVNVQAAFMSGKFENRELCKICLHALPCHGWYCTRSEVK